MSDFELKFSNAPDFETKFYNASEFELKSLQRVRLWIKNFTTRQILKENIFLKSMILKKKIFLKSTTLKKKLILKSRVSKKFCTQKITFWFNLPRKMSKFCVLRAILKITNLKKETSLESMILNIKLFALSDFELKFSQRVRFLFNFLNTRHIFNWLFYRASDFECTSLAICQVFMCSIKQGTFR